MNSDEALLIYLQLSERGYGTVKEISEWDARTVVQALHYVTFRADYDRASQEMHK